ncbi:MAG: hypothetical protein MUE83_06575 [Tabrizicola sp.]|jgi:hypothetical protein|nr:hypothetical protein [Tabrizicola sp.]
MADSWETYLQPGERILWEGAPLPGIRNRVRLVFLSLFGVPFFIAGLGGSAVALRQIFVLGDVLLGLFVLALGLVFVVIGYAMVVGQWVEAARAYRTTRYAVSSRSAYIARLGRKRTLESYPILPKTALELDHCDGYDNVWFHVRMEDGSEGGLSTTRIGFEGIKDGTAVYQVLRGIQTGQT